MKFITETPNLVAVAGDWHGDTAYAVNVIHQLAEVDVDIIVHTGDFGYWPRDGKDEFIDRLTEVLEATDLELWFVDGNHENHTALNEIPLNEEGLRPLSNRIFHIPRGFRWTWGETTWMGFGGATSVERNQRVTYVSWFPEEEHTEEELEYALRPGNVDVVVSHDSPNLSALIFDFCKGPSGWSESVLVKAAASRHRLDRLLEAKNPSFWYHGHYHMSYTNPALGTMITGLHCNGTPITQNIFLCDASGKKSYI
jgi:Icc-related predicted phosphoesterase